MALCPAHRELTSPRLVLVAGSPNLASAVTHYLIRNRQHFAPWDPPLPDSFFTEAAQAERLTTEHQAFGQGSALRWWLTEPAVSNRIVGSVHFSQIARGAFQNASLGYALDAGLQGLGLMHEALAAALAEVFSPRVNLHRVQAAVRPENARSLAVLKRLGFEHEGLAKDYLFIAGGWRDHSLHALCNPHFMAPSGWGDADSAVR